MIAWNKGLTKENDKRVAQCSKSNTNNPKRIGRHMSSKTEFKKSQRPWNKNLIYTNEQKKNMLIINKQLSTPERNKQISETLKRKYNSGEIEVWNKNTKYTEDMKTEKLKEYWKSKRGKPTWNKGISYKPLEQHHNWQGGKSFELYDIEFNNKLKNRIRERDNYTCQECRYTEKQLKRKLSIHHIDYNKKNNNKDNLISLCINCHMQTNYNRNDWIKYFQEKIVK